jgi:hypothetical protein
MDHAIIDNDSLTAEQFTFEGSPSELKEGREMSLAQVMNNNRKPCSDVNAVTSRA